MELQGEEDNKSHSLWLCADTNQNIFSESFFVGEAEKDGQVCYLSTQIAIAWDSGRSWFWPAKFPNCWRFSSFFWIPSVVLVELKVLISKVQKVSTYCRRDK
jgi:hypothetical protein